MCVSIGAQVQRNSSTLSIFRIAGKNVQLPIQLQKVPKSFHHTLSLQETDHAKNGVLLLYLNCICLFLTFANDRVKQ